ncbi:MAG: LamG domain-containing protein, partial [Planctomycetes bacterium]|nr:LamG domain-containing protein [Planctomycetota bacterium]
MMRTTATLGCVLVMSAMAIAQPAQVRLAERWLSAYGGEDAAGKHVIALWKFDAGAETKDASGHGHDLTLRGAAFSPAGRFGGALESACGWPKEDKPHQAVAKNDPKLSPRGAFTLEMWIQARRELEGYPDAFLLDKKYSDHTDYQFILTAADPSGVRRLRVSLGFGSDSAVFMSDAARYEPGVWHHVAFTYDGAGTGRFYRDGASLGGKTEPGRANVIPGARQLTIGDRIGSLYHGFPGLIDEVRLCNGVLEFRPAAFAFASERTAFVRMEKARPLTFTLANLLPAPLTAAKARFSLQGGPGTEVAVPELKPGAVHALAYALDTSLRPGRYRLAARIEIPGEKPYVSEDRFEITLVPRPLSRMPVVMWGANPKEVQRLKDIGFTHCGGLGADFGKIWDAGKPTAATTPERVAQEKRELDEALANGLHVFASLSPGRWARDKKDFQRVGKDGKPYKHEDVCGLFPAIQDFCYNVGASVAQTYGEFPAWNAAIIHTEVRGESQVCFHEHDKAAFKKFAGFDIPAEGAVMRSTPYQSLKDFPASRVIPDNHPLHVFYQWLWHQGDGWNALHTAVHRGLKSTGRQDLWTWHDPAVRAASAWGSGGDVDFLSQWTYSYPDPIRIGMATDELFAMLGGGPAHQKVMKMTQIIWYRSQTAPEPGEAATKQAADFADKDVKAASKAAPTKPEAHQAEWETRIPDARFITIAPMHLREAFWTKMARPIQGIMYHGWGSLVEDVQHGGYRYTHPETKHELRRLVKTVLEPLGPALMQVPDRKSDVAFLESFASQMFAKRGTWGWNGGWAGDVYLILMHAQLQPEILYDETVLKRGLDDFKALVMADCDVLIESVAKKVQAFQARGGLVIGDERLCPAIKPDILVQSFERPKKADEARALLQ